MNDAAWDELIAEAPPGARPIMEARRADSAALQPIIESWRNDNARLREENERLVEAVDFYEEKAEALDALLGCVQVENKLLTEALQEIADMEVGETNAPKFVQAAQWHVMQRIARAALAQASP